MLLSKQEPPNLQELGTVPPIGPACTSIMVFWCQKKGQLVPTMGKHRAKQELETIPPQEMGTVVLEVQKRPLRWHCF